MYLASCLARGDPTRAFSCDVRWLGCLVALVVRFNTCLLQLLARTACWLVCNLRPGDYLPTYLPKLGSHLPKLGSRLPLESYLPPQGVRNDPHGPMGGVRNDPHRPTGLSLRQLRAHALALRLQHAKLSESLKMQFKAQKAEEKRRKSEASADAADAAAAPSAAAGKKRAHA